MSYEIVSMIFCLLTSYTFFQVALTHGPQNVKPQMKQTDDKGYFCFEVLHIIFS